MRQFLIFILIIQFSLIKAQIGGSHTYSFLNLPISAKIVSLGGDNVSIKEASVILNNPALMDSSTANYANFSFVHYFAGVNWGNCSYSFKPSKFGNFALAMHYINYGKFTAADEIGNITGEFTAADYIFSALWSYQLDSSWTIGATIKPLLSQYETYSSVGLAADLGITYFSDNNNFSAGLVFKNFGKQLKPYVPDNYEKLPFDIQIGISQKLQYAPFRFSITAHHLNKPNLGYEIDNDIQDFSNSSINENQQNKFGEIADLTLRHFLFGVELLPSDYFYIALGFNYQRRQELKIDTKTGLTGFSAGLGLNLKKFSFNYGIAKYHLAGSSQNFSLSVNLNNIF